MLRSRLSQPVLASCLLLSALGVASPAAGESAFPKLLDVLLANGTIDSDTHAALVEAAEADARRARRRASDAVVETGKGEAIVRSRDGAFEFHADGRLDFDGAWYADDEADLGDGLEVRRVRLGLEGTLWRDWDFEIDVDFEEDEVGVKDAYLQYAGFENVRIRAGHVREPFSLEEVTSTRYVTFMERALPNVLTPGRNLGLRLHTSGSRWRVALGAFGQGLDEPDDGDESWAFTGRASFLPVVWSRGLVHLGGSVSYRAFEDENEIDFRTRPESEVTDVRLVDTDDIEDVDDLLLWGLEAAAVAGPLSIQGEYIAARLDRSPGESLDFEGWYAYLSWFLTGESRKYKPSRGRFGRLVPDRSLREGGPGALEVALRLSRVDLTDRDVIGGEQTDLTAGFNWYVERNLRFMANWVKVLEVDRPGTATDGDEPSLFQVRAQLDF